MNWVDGDSVPTARLRGMASAWARVGRRERPATVPSDISAYRGMRAVQRRIVEAGGWTRGPSSLMAVIGMACNEVVNCRVVGWLFDPLARHGIGVPMIEKLATHLGLPVKDAPSATSSLEVSRTRSRADVVLADGGGAWTVVIEAKVDAPEGLDQGRRLEGDWPNASMVFLTRSGMHTPVTASEPDRWRRLSWRWVADTAVELLEDRSKVRVERGSEAREAVLAWAAAVRRELT